MRNGCSGVNRLGPLAAVCQWSRGQPRCLNLRCGNGIIIGTYTFFILTEISNLSKTPGLLVGSVAKYRDCPLPVICNYG